MKLKYFSIALDSDDYLTPNKPGSEFPYSVLPIVSDFSFQAFYVSDFIQKRIAKEKFETNGYERITIRARKNPEAKLVFKEHLKSLNIEIPFNEKKYKELYPYQNKYPLKGLLKPVEDEGAFCEFLISMIIEGMMEVEKEKLNWKHDFIIDMALYFKSNGCKNEWTHKVKVFKGHGLKAILLCSLTVNYFSLVLIVEKGNKELFRKEILKTLPSDIQYGDEFKDVVIKGDDLLVTKNMYDAPPLFALSLSELTAKGAH